VRVVQRIECDVCVCVCVCVCVWLGECTVRVVSRVHVRVPATSSVRCGALHACLTCVRFPLCAHHVHHTHTHIHTQTHTPITHYQIAGELEDRSPKGSVDRPIVPLVKLFFESDAYFTTSSCSGRVALFAEVQTPTHMQTEPPRQPETKAGLGGWLFVSHAPVTVTQLRDSLLERELAHSRAGISHIGPLGLEDTPVRAPTTATAACTAPANAALTATPTTATTGASSQVTCAPASASSASSSSRGESNEQRSESVESDAVQVYARFEPFVIHVCCRSLQDATALYRVARASGFRESGISVNTKGKVMVGIRTISLLLVVPLFSYRFLPVGQEEVCVCVCARVCVRVRMVRCTARVY
jgi:tRNA(Phe) wybutosine-synthesizing methylase Tyw3